MQNQRRLLSAVVVLSSVIVQGCAGYTVGWDRRDAPWDPPPGRVMFEQIPNSDAHRVCGGRLPEDERRRQGLSGRC
jgi:uncharacterized membrane protein